jgi:hypothetical protein
MVPGALYQQRRRDKIIIGQIMHPPIRHPIPEQKPAAPKLALPPWDEKRCVKKLINFDIDSQNINPPCVRVGISRPSFTLPIVDEFCGEESKKRTLQPRHGGSIDCVQELGICRLRRTV